MSRFFVISSPTLQMHSPLVSCLLTLGLLAVVYPQSDSWQFPNETQLQHKVEPVQWSPDLQVVIEDDNQIKLERTKQLKELSDIERHNSLLNYFSNEKPDLELTSFESKRLKHDQSMSTAPLVNYTAEPVELSSGSVSISESVSPNRYSRIIPPSFSKMPDYVSEQLMASDARSVHSSEEPQRNVARTVMVPIGSRVHTIQYQDYAPALSAQPASQPISARLVSSYFSKYEPNVIEVPSSKPVLPIVFNFRTKSSPIVTTQTHLKLLSSTPKVQYFETNEPPQIHSHVVHKPIYQDVREIIVPYRVLVQEIKPVHESVQTIAHINKRPQQPAKYHTYLADYTPTVHSPSLALPSSSPPIPYEPTGQHSSSQLTPLFGYSSMLHKNPYMDISYHIPYRIEDLYKKPPTYEQPKYLSLNKFNKYSN